jgi:hypothetical protein
MATLKKIVLINKDGPDGAPGELGRQGFVFSVTIGETVFQIRHSDHLAGGFIVVNPATARLSPQAKQLVNYLTGVLAGRQIFFFDEAGGGYREVDLKTLKFLAGENTVPSQSFKATKSRVSELGSAVWRPLPA